MMRFTRTDALERLADDLSRIGPDWDAIERAARDSVFFSTQRREAGNDVGFLAELHVQDALRKLAQSGRYVFGPDPLPGSASTNKYSFFRQDHRVIVKKYVPEGTGNLRDPHYPTICDIDGLVAFEGIPLVLEVKERSDAHGGTGHKGSVNHALSLRQAGIVIDPLRRYFGTEPAYIAFLPENLVSRESKVQSALRAEGGIVASLPWNGRSFGRAARRFLAASGLAYGTSREYANGGRFGIEGTSLSALEEFRHRLG